MRHGAEVTNAGGFGVLGAVAHTPETLEIDLAWIDAKVAGKEIVTMTEEEPKVVDIMTALKASIEAAKKKPMEKAKGSTEMVEKKTARRKAG